MPTVKPSLSPTDKLKEIEQDLHTAIESIAAIHTATGIGWSSAAQWIVACASARTLDPTAPIPYDHRQDACKVAIWEASGLLLEPYCAMSIPERQGHLAGLLRHYEIKTAAEAKPYVAVRDPLACPRCGAGVERIVQVQPSSALCKCGACGAELGHKGWQINPDRRK
jgi:hypothetical protein